MQSIIRELADINNRLEDKIKEEKKEESLEDYINNSREILDETVVRISSLEEIVNQLKGENDFTR